MSALTEQHIAVLRALVDRGTFLGDPLGHHFEVHHEMARRRLVTLGALS